MSGGIKSWDSETASGPEELGLELFEGHESPVDILKVAYSLEQGLKEFYLSMEKQAENEKVKSLFKKLAAIEIKHQMSIYQAVCDVTGEKTGLDEFEKQVETRAMEGGLTTEQYLAMFNPDLDSAVDVVSLAMSIEAQALDLYQRVGKNIDNPVSREIVRKIAEEEKVHLASLGELMEKLEQ